MLKEERRKLMEGLRDKMITAKLVNTPNLDLVDRAIGMCHASGCKADPDERKKRILRVIGYKHYSVLRFIEFIFEVTATTSALLQASRHGPGVDFMVESTRYVISKRLQSQEPLLLDTEEENEALKIKLLKLKELGYKNDELKEHLPQSYLYKMLIRFNGESLRHFLKLRLARDAHIDIRVMSAKIVEAIPQECLFLFEDILEKHHTETEK